MLKRALALTLPLLLLIPKTEVWGRWATLSDASILIKDNKSIFHIQKNGQYQVDEIENVEILKEEARSRYGTTRIVYNSRAEKIEVLLAETLTPDGKRHRVPPELIQDKPLASTREGFDQMNQISIAFPEVSIGSILHLETRRHLEEPPFPGFFGMQFIYGSPEPEAKSELRFVSEMPLTIEVNDPRAILKIGKTEEKKNSQVLHVLEVSHQKLEFRRATDETDPYLQGRAFTWVNVASHPTWDAMAKGLVPEYEARLKAPLPPLFEKIRENAAREKPGVDQINRVTEQLAEELHYWADWRPIRGGHVPRPLETIATSRFGDCKDFSVATAAILRALGLQAFPAWIRREYRPIFSPNQLPHPGAFNHAIVRVKDAKSGEAFWIDPTNKISFADGTFEDIIDRPALVLYPDSPQLETVPPAQAQDSMVEIKLKRRLGNTTTPSLIQGDLNLIGRRAVPFTGENLNRTRTSTDQDLVRLFSEEGKTIDWKVAPYDLTSRIVKPLHFHFDIHEDGSPPIRSTAGDGIPLPGSTATRKILNIGKDRISDLFLGQPYQTKKETLFVGIEPVGGRNLHCQIESPWIRFSRDLRRTKEGTLIQEEFSTLKTTLLLEETRTKSFKAFSKQLRACAEGNVLIYRSKKAQSSEKKPL